MTIGSPFVRWFGKVTRWLCALAIATVTTFHVCDAVAARGVDLVTVVQDASDKKAGDIVAVEKCHVCAVVSFFVVVVSLAPEAPTRSIPSGSILHLASFRQPYKGPPPRA